MTQYRIYYCLSSSKKYLAFEESLLTESLNEAVSLLDHIKTDEDTIYIDCVQSQDRIILTGDEECDVFLEVDSAKGGVLSKDMSFQEVRRFLETICFDFNVLDAKGFKSESI